MLLWNLLKKYSSRKFYFVNLIWKVNLFYFFRLFALNLCTFGRFFWAFFGYAFFTVFAEDLQHEKLSGSVAGKSGSKRSDRQDAQDDSEPSCPRSENGQERKYDSQHNPHDLLGFYNIFLHPIYLLIVMFFVIGSGIILPTVLEAIKTSHSSGVRIKRRSKRRRKSSPRAQGRYLYTL